MTNTPTAARTQLILTVVTWLALGVCVYSIADDSLTQWDFDVYYSAAHLFAAGGNPYSPLHPHPGLRGDLIYQYPPLTLLLFVWTPLFSLQAAKLLWLTAKLAAIMFMAWLWHRDFERLNLRWPTVWVIALGFNATLLRDLVCGNISTFEQLGLWLGFSLLLRGRPYAAALLIAGVAQFKLLPAGLLGLIPLVRSRDGWRPFFAGCGLFLGVLALNVAFDPGLTDHYVRLFSDANLRMDDRNLNNPSSLALFRDIVESTAMIPGLSFNRIGGTWAYSFFVIMIVLLIIRAAADKPGAIRRADPRLLIYFGCSLYALTMPRMKDYSYILLLLPALFVITDLTRRGRAANYPILAVAAVLFTQPQQSNVPGLAGLIIMLQAYMPLVFAGGVMCYVLRALLENDSRDRGERHWMFSEERIADIVR